MLDAGRTQIAETEMALCFALAALLGGLIGLDRELKDRPAGLRTNMLTALAAAVFTVVTLEIFHIVNTGASPGAGDPLRIIEAVTAGVAFLAAGTIIQSGGKVEGLTTGAGMWLAGAIGVACGGGFLILAFIATVLAGLILTVVHWCEQWALGKARESAPPSNDP
jgi:putative Mg2+ transporter-C (MgtC) family protein